MAISNSTNPYQRVYQVLIIDDSEADFELYQSFLAQDKIYAYRLHYAQTARKGLQLFLANPPDLILVDFSLPDKNGLELVEAIHRIDELPYIPIIMMTGLGNEAIALQAMKKNIQDYLVKGNLDFYNFIHAIYRVVTGLESKISLDDNIFDILIVDDSEADLEHYRRFLKKDPDVQFNVTEASTVKKALEVLDNKKIDVILTDYSLPDKSGLDLIKAFKSLNPTNDSCIIMMTGQGNEQLVVDAIKSGASDYLVKQFLTPESLRKSVKDNILKTRLFTHISKSQFQRNLLSRMSLRIRHSLNLDEVIQTAVVEIKNYLQCDRVLIYHIDADGDGKILGEAVEPPFEKTLGLNITDTFFKDKSNHDDYILNCRKQVINDITDGNVDPCHRQLLEGFQVKSIASIPIIIEHSTNPLWGLLIVHFCKDIHFWEQNEIAFLNELTLPISMGIQQGLLVEELIKERDRANASTRAKSAFLANMSHEIRTPMNGILGMAEILSLDNLNEQHQDYVDIIRSSGNSLLNLINDILDLSKLESGKVELESIEFSLQNVIRDLLSLFQVAAQEKNLKIFVDIDKSIPTRYLGDSGRLKQVLINLIGNAIKFTFAGNVKIIIKEFVTDDEDESKIQLYFGIEDTGIGIALEAQNLLFQPFSQVESSTTRRFGGTGLGLAICKQIVELMDGSIGVESHPNQGSTFWFTAKFQYLDRLPQAAIQKPSPKEPIKQVVLKTEKILLAEDNAINQKVVVTQFQRMGYECDIAENGEVVLAKLKQKSYDIIFMDCQMPVLDGYDTTRIIRQNEQMQDLIIIGLTAFAMKDDREKCLDAGMNDYLAKPYTIPILQEMINKWI